MNVIKDLVFSFSQKGMYFICYWYGINRKTKIWILVGQSLNRYPTQSSKRRVDQAHFHRCRVASASAAAQVDELARHQSIELTWRIFTVVALPRLQQPSQRCLCRSSQ